MKYYLESFLGKLVDNSTECQHKNPPTCLRFLLVQTDTSPVCVSKHDALRNRTVLIPLTVTYEMSHNMSKLPGKQRTTETHPTGCKDGRPLNRSAGFFTPLHAFTHTRARVSPSVELVERKEDSDEKELLGRETRLVGELGNKREARHESQ